MESGRPKYEMQDTYKLERDKEKIVHNEGPFAPVSISRDAKKYGADRTEHQH